MICLSPCGAVARDVAACRPHVPVMCYVASQKVGRQLQVHRGLYPIIHETEARPTVPQALASAQEMGWVSQGNQVLVVEDHGRVRLLAL